jgi:hypothetical protein
MASRKVRADALNRLQRYVAELPPCQPEEMTTREAVGMALPQIHAMQSKGYSLDAIAKILSEIGIEVTAAGLKRYVHLAEAERPRGARKPIRPSRAAGDAGDASADPTQQNAIESGVTTVAAETVATTREGASSRTASAEPAKKEVAAASTASRRVACVTRKGTEDN